MLGLIIRVLGLLVIRDYTNKLFPLFGDKDTSLPPVTISFTREIRPAVSPLSEARATRDINKEDTPKNDAAQDVAKEPVSAITPIAITTSTSATGVTRLSTLTPVTPEPSCSSKRKARPSFLYLSSSLRSARQRNTH